MARADSGQVTVTRNEKENFMLELDRIEVDWTGTGRWPGFKKMLP